MFREKDGVLAATNELMSLHVSRETRRGAPMRASVIEKLRTVERAHAALDIPAEAGRIIGLGARSTTGGSG